MAKVINVGNKLRYTPLIENASAYSQATPEDEILTGLVGPSFYADFSGVPLSGNAPLTVTFTDYSTFDPGYTGSYYELEWEYSDDPWTPAGIVSGAFSSTYELTMPTTTGWYNIYYRVGCLVSGEYGWEIEWDEEYKGYYILVLSAPPSPPVTPRRRVKTPIVARPGVDRVTREMHQLRNRTVFTETKYERDQRRRRVPVKKGTWTEKKTGKTVQF